MRDPILDLRALGRDRRLIVRSVTLAIAQAVPSELGPIPVGAPASAATP